MARFMSPMNTNVPFPTSSEVHVWAIWLTAPEKTACAYRELLLPDETARADKFAFDQLRRRYEISQGGLRLLLSRYLSCHPRELTFSFGPRGKPALCDSELEFNLSNSGDLSVYVITVGCAVGVDVEQVKPLRDLENIASRYFCGAEARELLSIGSKLAMQEAFFRCWTRKEAYIKAVGTGLYLPLDRFQVTLLASDPPRFVHIGESPTIANEWTLQHLDPAPGYAAALAYHAHAPTIVFQQPLAPDELLEQATN